MKDVKCKDFLNPYRYMYEGLCETKVENKYWNVFHLASTW